jgi:hypothetical protein
MTATPEQGRASPIAQELAQKLEQQLKELCERVEALENALCIPYRSFNQTKAGRTALLGIPGQYVFVMGVGNSKESEMTRERKSQ